MATSIWKGRKVGSFKDLLGTLDSEIESTIGRFPKVEDVIEACDAISRRIRSGDIGRYREALERDGSEDPMAIINALAEVYSRESMMRKIDRELGTQDLFELNRISATEQPFMISAMGAMLAKVGVRRRNRARYLAPLPVVY